MRQSHQPSTSETGSNHDPSRQLTDAQRAFADVVGRELACLWIEQQAGASQNTDYELPRQRSRRLRPEGDFA